MDSQHVNYKPISPAAMVNLVLVGILVIVAISLISTCYYTVDTDEKGVVLLFGKFNRVTDPGLRFKWPMGIETVTKVGVTNIETEEFGFRTLSAGVKTRYSTDKSRFIKESLMLCGDLSIAQVEWIVQYRVSDPKAFLFHVGEKRKVKMIRDVAESVMRKVVGDSSVDEVLTERRSQINYEAERLMQEHMDAYDTGISIEKIRLRDVNPPESVKSAFNEVNSAQQDKERMVNEARKEYNQVIPKAKGQALQMVEQAQAYAIDRTNTAEGDASRFVQVWQEYKNSKEVTRKRMYLETMNRVFPKIEKKYIVDEQVKGLLPLMNLGDK